MIICKITKNKNNNSCKYSPREHISIKNITEMNTENNKV